MDTAQILADLRAQRNRIDNAITALEALNGTIPLSKPAAALVPVKQASQKVRRIKIAAAQEARWAAKKKPTKPVADAKQAAPKKAATKTTKRMISAESRKKMAEAQKKRWAKKKTAAKGAAKKAAAVTATSTEAPKA